MFPLESPALLYRGWLDPQGCGGELWHPHCGGGAGVQGPAACGKPGDLPHPGEGWNKREDTTHRACLCCEAAIVLFEGWGHMTPGSPQLRIRAGAQEGSLGKQSSLAISTDWELGVLLVHTHEGRAVLWGWGRISGHHGALHSPAAPCQILTESALSSSEEPVRGGSQWDCAGAPGLLCQVHLLL